jgi:hypothetical protein
MNDQFRIVYQIAADQYASMATFQSAVRAISIVVAVAGLFMLSLLISRRIRKSLLLVAGLAFVGISLLVIGITFALHHFQTNDALKAFQTGQYSMVEGQVENFDPMPFEGHKPECFSVGETRFCYSDYIVAPGFRNTASHGGPIRSGLLVRIAYKKMGSQNTILRLEVAK